MAAPGGAHPVRAGENARFLLEAGGEDYEAHARWGELQTAYTGSRVVPGWTMTCAG